MNLKITNAIAGFTALGFICCIGISFGANRFGDRYKKITAETYALWSPGDGIVLVDKNDVGYMWDCSVRQKCLRPYKSYGKVKRISKSVVQLDDHPTYACSTNLKMDYSIPAVCNRNGWSQIK